MSDPAWGTVLFFVTVIVVVTLLFVVAAKLGSAAGRRDADKLPPNNRTVGRDS